MLVTLEPKDLGKLKQLWKYVFDEVYGERGPLNNDMPELNAAVEQMNGFLENEVFIT